MIHLFKIALIIVMISKFLYIISEINLRYDKEYYAAYKELIKAHKERNRIVYVASDTLMSLLLIYLFIPLSYGGIQISYIEKFSLFFLGVFNLLQFEWLEIFKYFGF